MKPECVLCGRSCPERFRVGVYAVHRCAPCDLEFVWPTPSPEELRAVYERGYFTGAGVGYEDYFGRERAIAARKSSARLDAIEALVPARGKLLDFGCAAGYFVEAARERGWDAVGVEPSAEARHGASEPVRPHLASNLDALRSRAPFDVVTAWDVLEHMTDPLDTLRALRGCTRVGGVFGVVVPVIGNVNTRVAPRTWDQYKPPEHLYFFSRRALRAALRKGAGAAVVREEIAWSRPARFIDPEGLSRSPLTRVGRAVDAAIHRVARAVAPSLTVDSVAFYAQVET